MHQRRFETKHILRYWDRDGTKNPKTSYNYVDFVYFKNRILYFDWF
ncbi:hypothetical protein HMPREF3189_01315 [Clostridiales bacterium KA00134]|nr:hypothetical protein HMPREF3189_01315 [Clostridiales bacterium KA00134]